MFSFYLVIRVVLVFLAFCMILLTVTVVFVWSVTFMCGETVGTLCGERTTRQKLRRTDITVGFVVLNLLVSVRYIIREYSRLLGVTLYNPWHLWTIISSVPGNTQVSVRDTQSQVGCCSSSYYELSDLKNPLSLQQEALWFVWCRHSRRLRVSGVSLFSTSISKTTGYRPNIISRISPRV